MEKENNRKIKKSLPALAFPSSAPSGGASDTKNRSPFLFTKKINKSWRLVPFNSMINPSGETKYLPPFAKEWKNSTYSFYHENTKNFPVYDRKINSLIKGYFSLYFNHKFLEHKYISRKTKRKSLNRIFVSKAEIKHTPKTAKITIYVFNRERRILAKKMKRLRKILKNFMTFIMTHAYTKKYLFLKNQLWLKNKKIFNHRYSKDIFWLLTNFQMKDIIETINVRYFHRIRRFFKKVNRIVMTFSRFKWKWNLNKYKLEERFLSRLSKFLSKYYQKKVELNIVNLKSVGNNSDILTEILTLKLKKPKSSPIRRINAVLAKVVLPKENRVKERGRIEKQVNYELIQNRFHYLNASYIIDQTYHPSTPGKKKFASSTTFNSASESSTSCPTSPGIHFHQLLYQFSSQPPARAPSSSRRRSPLVFSSILSTLRKRVVSNLDLSQGQEGTRKKSQNKKNGIGVFGRGRLKRIPFLPIYKAGRRSQQLGPVKTKSSCAQVFQAANYLDLRNILFKNLRYKLASGARVTVNGRLTRRYRADRSVHKLKWKGGLNNVDSSFRGLSTVQFLGYRDANITQSIMASKRRIGAFAAKVWLAGKN